VCEVFKFHCEVELMMITDPANNLSQLGLMLKS
jgi:hypothetical protein